MPVKNEIGNRYERLVVIERAENDKDGRAKWVCQCDCGNICIVRGKDLRQGKQKSCGCLRNKIASERELINEIGNRYGKLLVIDREGVDNFNRATWRCQCDCGNTHIVAGYILRAGDVHSCGCINYSLGEEAVAKLLDEFGIKYQREFSFNDLKSIKNRVLRFDFAIFDSKNNLTHLIEFDGPQHYDLTNNYYTEDLVKNDALKNAYCRDKGIKLIRLRGYENLTIEDLEVK